MNELRGVRYSVSKLNTIFEEKRRTIEQSTGNVLRGVFVELKEG